MSCRTMHRLIGLFAGVLLTVSAHAQTAWPTRPITMIVPYSAGGGADPVARLLGDGIGKLLGQSIIVEFRPGANATIGTRDVAKAAPDGYTVLFTPAAPIINMKLLMPDLGYEPGDLTRIIELTNSPNALMVSSQFGPKTLQEYVDYAKHNPGNVNIGVAALGGGGHLGAVLIEQVTDTSLNIVPYKGTGELLPDMLSGSLDSSSDFPAAYVPHAKAGTVKILAMFSDQRVPAFPDVPTSAEGGFPKLVIGGWFGLFGPKGLPRDIVDKLNAAANTELKDPQIRARIESLGYQLIGGTPEQFAKQIDSDFVTIGDLVKLGHIALQ